MYVELAEINRLKGQRAIYLLVKFWRSEAWANAGNEPDLVNDFIMQLRRTETQIVTDANGWLKTVGGEFIDPATLEPGGKEYEWERETITKTRADLLGEVRENIRRYAREAVKNKWRGDHTGDATRPFFVDNQRITQRVAQVFEREDVDEGDGVLTLLRAVRGRKESIETAEGVSSSLR